MPPWARSALGSGFQPTQAVREQPECPVEPDVLVDVLQRVGQHPAAEVVQLTPRLWKQHFAANPLRSDLLPSSK